MPARTDIAAHTRKITGYASWQHPSVALLYYSLHIVSLWYEHNLHTEWVCTNYYDWRQSNYKNSRNKNIKSYSTSETRCFLKSSAWIAYIGLYVTWLAINEVLETCITLTFIKYKYVYNSTLMKKLKAGYISEMLPII